MYKTSEFIAAHSFRSLCSLHHTAICVCVCVNRWNNIISILNFNQINVRLYAQSTQYFGHSREPFFFTLYSWRSLQSRTAIRKKKMILNWINMLETGRHLNPISINSQKSERRRRRHRRRKIGAHWVVVGQVGNNDSRHITKPLSK